MSFSLKIVAFNSWMTPQTVLGRLPQKTVQSSHTIGSIKLDWVTFKTPATFSDASHLYWSITSCLSNQTMPYPSPT